MGCTVYDTPGTYTFTWPDGVTRAVVSCKGSSGGGASGQNAAGRGAGGGGAFAERLVIKTDATATVQVPAGGLGGVGNNVPGNDGVAASFIQASSVVEYCGAAGGKKGNAGSGGVGGLASDSYGTIKHNGGNGGSAGTGDGGGGGGAAACADSDGENGLDEPGTTLGGEGGAKCPNTGNDATGGGKGGDEFQAGSAGTNGGGGGGGIRGGANRNGGDGSAGVVTVCWEDPVPDGYCISTGTTRAWWPRCQYYCSGLACFYYGYHPYAAPVPCNSCPSGTLPSVVYLTFDGTGACGVDGETVRLVYNPAAVSYPRWEWDGVGSAALLNMLDHTSPYLAIFCQGAPTGSVGVLANFDGTSASFYAVGECEPALFIGTWPSTPPLCTTTTVQFTITE